MECTVKWMSACARIDLARTMLLVWICSWIISVCKYTSLHKRSFFCTQRKNITIIRMITILRIELMYRCAWLTAMSPDIQLLNRLFYSYDNYIVYIFNYIY